MGVYKKVKGDGARYIPHQVIKDLLTVRPACRRQDCLSADRVVRFKCGDKSYLVRTELNGKAYLGVRAIGRIPLRVLELGKM